MFTLYHSTLCPFSRQVRIILCEKSIKFNLINENYWEHDLTFARINPAMELPVLVEPDGMIIAGIYPILEYLIEYNNDNMFFSENAHEKVEYRRLISWFNNKFYHEVGKLIINEKIISFYVNQGEPNSDLLRAAKHNLANHINYIQYLLVRRKFLAGERLTLIDFIAAAHLSILDYLGYIMWDKNEVIKEWYSIIKSRPSFSSILEDRILGFTPPKNYLMLDF